MSETYIEECRTSQHPVKVITINGFQMIGKIVEHEEDSILVQCGNIKKLVYKHAISTIEPVKLK